MPVLLPLLMPYDLREASSMASALGATIVSGGPRIDRVRVVSKASTVELKVDLAAQYDNPFDSSQVALDAVVRAPSGRTMTVPGFLFRPYRRSVGRTTVAIAYASTDALSKGAAKEKTVDAGEILTPTGPPSWRVRFTPQETGLYVTTLVLRSGGKTVRAKGPSVKVAVEKGGFVRVDPKNPRAFRLSSGQPYFPLGANIGWAGERGTRDYDDWLPAYGRAGANWGRVWMSPSWTTFGLESPATGFGRIDLANAWRLDYALDLATKHGMRLALCIDSYNVLRDRINWPEWERSVYNAANGGRLKTPSEFWTDAETMRRYRDKLRYVVARWGASPNVFAWEFWNEVDGVTDYRVEPVARWHAEMATYLRKIDPYRHLVSTSYGGNGAGAGDAKVFGLKGLDFSTSHIYEATDIALAVADAERRLGALGKPHFVGETGADTTGSRSEDDPTGLQLHDPLWASLAAGSAGGAMLWWWDSYVHPKNLYPLLTPVSRFLKGVDWGAQRMTEVRPTLAYVHPPSPLPRRDLKILGGATGWLPSPENRPQTLRISSGGVQGGPIGGVMNGVGNHPDLHNPLTFDTDLDRPVRFIVEASDVSGYGGAGLRISLDGRLVLSKDFPDPDGDRVTATLKNFAGDYAIEVPAGRHTIFVENPGADWVKADYRFEGAADRTGPELTVLASVGKSFAMAWLRQEDRTWRRVVEGKAPIRTIPEARLTLPGLAPGRWTAEVWDTWKGVALSRRAVTVGKDGRATLDLPPVQGDLAVRWTKATSARP